MVMNWDNGFKPKGVVKPGMQQSFPVQQGNNITVLFRAPDPAISPQTPPGPLIQIPRFEGGRVITCNDGHTQFWPITAHEIALLQGYSV